MACLSVKDSTMALRPFFFFRLSVCYSRGYPCPYTTRTPNIYYYSLPNIDTLPVICADTRARTPLAHYQSLSKTSLHMRVWVRDNVRVRESQINTSVHTYISACMHSCMHTHTCIRAE